MKVKPHLLSESDNIRTHDALYTAAASLKGRDAMKLFLRDLLTPSERVMLGRRIIIARHLLTGKSYRDIQADLSVGKVTIAKVDRWLSDQMPGYEQAIEGMELEFTKRNPQLGTLAHLKKKYPLYFILYPWPKKKLRRDTNNKQTAK
jgi:uncharacterized protein YerC